MNRYFSPISNRYLAPCHIFLGARNSDIVQAWHREIVLTPRANPAVNPVNLLGRWNPVIILSNLVEHGEYVSTVPTDVSHGHQDHR